ncbi:hypoxanthine phosphoribosyltransferase [Candidatus Atribacteria bacterium 4572_76]|nr:MAG: hypoxanthine phosphoribosyltransferase [Candidatus Atribacteria bacterium 4572_76]
MLKNNEIDEILITEGEIREKVIELGGKITRDYQGKDLVFIGVLRILKDLDETIVGKDVLVVEDIVDTGLTLDYLLRILKSRKPSSLKVCTFLNKSARRKVKIKVDYLGFDIPDKFVVGYGLDYAGKFRNVPFVFTLNPEIYKGELK